jgi:flagellar hook-length control protein FliK
VIAPAMISAAASAESLPGGQSAAPAKAQSKDFAVALLVEMKTQAAKHGRSESKKASVPVLGPVQQESPLPPILHGIGAGAGATASHGLATLHSAQPRVLWPTAAGIAKPAAATPGASQPSAPGAAQPSAQSAAQPSAPSAAPPNAPRAAGSAKEVTANATTPMTAAKPTTAGAKATAAAQTSPLAAAAAQPEPALPPAPKLGVAAKPVVASARAGAAARAQHPEAALPQVLSAATVHATGKAVTEALTAAELPAGTKGMRGESYRITADKQSQAAAVAAAQGQPIGGGTPIAGLSREVSVQIAEAARAEAPHIQHGGASMVRIALNPPQLGHVSVTLRAGADGLSATLQAEEPAAAALLQMGQGELRQKLETLGLGPAEVKVSVHGESQAVRPTRRSNAGGRR